MINLIIYSLSLLLTIGGILALIYIVSKHNFTFRDLTFIIATALFIGITFTAVSTGIKISERISIDFNLPKDIYSEWKQDSIHNPINEKILYNHLLLMRAPHAKIIYAQAIHESDHFKSDLFKRQRNCFGMKKSESRTTTSDQSKGDYKRYKDWQESCYDYIFWVFSRNVDKLSDDEYLDYIGKIYSEDKLYKEKIIKIINQTKFKELEN
jgi:hypothetical protein